MRGNETTGGSLDDRDPSPFWPIQNARPIRSNPELSRCNTLLVARNGRAEEHHEGRRVIALHKLRFQQQRIHATELSADPTQQKHAEAQLAAMTAGLVKLQKFLQPAP
jgi:hypothetical protein